uniref:EF-hand domain-containing protein n=1 Tax=Plectus sambesii TaxID=2011161 RepID=A0A914X0P0_9BILA
MISLSLCVASIIFLSVANGQGLPFNNFSPSPFRSFSPQPINSPYESNESDPESSNNIFKQTDADSDGKVTFNEFLLADREYILQQERSFKNFDTDGDGFITQLEHDSFYKRREEEEAESRRQQEKLFRQLVAGFDNRGNDKFGRYPPRTTFSLPFFLQGSNGSNQTFARAVDPPLVEPTVTTTTPASPSIPLS